MITFIEKSTWVDHSPLIGRTYAPIFMIKDGMEYFVANRVVRGSSLEHENLEGYKAMLLDTNGQYFKFYGIYDDPMELLAGVKERGHTFHSPQTLLCDCHGAPGYGAGFTDFSGSCREVALTFSYRIYDLDLVAALRSAVTELILQN